MRACLILASIFLACAAPEPKTPLPPLATPPASRPSPERVILLVDIIESPSDGPLNKLVRDVLEARCCDALTRAGVMTRLANQEPYKDVYPGYYSEDQAWGDSFKVGASFIVEGNLSKDDPPHFRWTVFDAGLGEPIWRREVVVTDTLAKAAELLATQLIEELIWKTKPCPSCLPDRLKKFSLVLSSRNGELSYQEVEALMNALPRKLRGLFEPKLVAFSSRSAVIEVLYYFKIKDLSREVGYVKAISRVIRATEDQVHLEME